MYDQTVYTGLFDQENINNDFTFKRTDNSTRHSFCKSTRLTREVMQVVKRFRHNKVVSENVSNR